MDKYRFPDNFFLGSATSAFQIEGAGETEWKNFTGADGTLLDRATDHYRMYKRDLEYILYLGNSYRFSMDWSKLQRRPCSPLEKDAVDHYKFILKTLKENNKRVLLVFNHFANPLWFYRIGCWTNRYSPYIFQNYVKKVLDTFAEYIDIINTFNEPNAYINMAYFFREFPPKKFNPVARNMALSNMSTAHSIIYDYIKKRFPAIPVGISHAHMIVELLNNRAIIPRLLKNFFDFIEHEHVHEYFTRNGQKVDYIGFSYYGRILVDGFPLLAYDEKGRKRMDELGIPHDDMWELYPEGIYKMLRFFYEKYKKPLLITENGTCTNDDSIRKMSLYKHLKYVKKACDENLPVLGYFHWSTFDNYELAHGPSRRFGLTSVDFSSPRFTRRIKESGHYYHNIVESNSLIEP